MTFLIVYFILVNFAGLFVMGMDKYRAKRDKWRIPEKRIWVLSIIGGSLGVYIGMRQFRHKTKHREFMYGIPAIIFIQLFLILYFYYL